MELILKFTLLTLGECLLSVPDAEGIWRGNSTSDEGWILSFLLSLWIGPSDKKSGRLLDAPTSPAVEGRSNGNDSGKSNGNTGGASLTLSLWLDVKSNGISGGCLLPLVHSSLLLGL